MDHKITKEWLLRQASLEDGLEVSTGGTTLEELERLANALEQTPSEQKYFATAFGALITLLRNRSGWSIAQLAKKAALEESELHSIETTAEYSPEPRTVLQLAKALAFPSRRMLELAGLVVSKDCDLKGYAVRFAASGKSIEKLTKEQQEVLDEFVKYLAK